MKFIESVNPSEARLFRGKPTGMLKAEETSHLSGTSAVDTSGGTSGGPRSYIEFGSSGELGSSRGSIICPGL